MTADLVRVVDVGAYLFAVGADGSVTVANQARTQFSPLPDWVPNPEHPDVFVAGPYNVIGADGQMAPMPGSTNGPRRGRGRFELPAPIVDVAADQVGLWLVTDDGQLWATTGFTPGGLTAMGPDGARIVRVVADRRTSVAVDDTGQLWGTDRTSSPMSPFGTRATPAPMTHVVMYGSARAGIDHDSRLWAWNATEPVQGLVSLSPRSLSPQFVDAQVGIGGHLWVHDTDGRLWTGGAASGRVELVDTAPPVRSFSATNTGHLWVLDPDGDLWSPRWNTVGYELNKTWLRYGPFGSERFTLLTEMISAAPAGSDLDGIVATADRLTG